MDDIIQGWLYGADFNTHDWYEQPRALLNVRRRKWVRIVWNKPEGKRFTCEMAP